MKGRKRQSGSLFRIKNIYEGHFQEMVDQIFFIWNEKAIPKIRIYGVVIDRYDKYEKDELSFSSLTLDDGSETIRMKLWSRNTKDSEYSFNPITLAEGVKVGDIIDVLGKVREYSGEFYIVPESISKSLDLDWEIHRRTKLLKTDMEEFGLEETENKPFESTTSQDAIDLEALLLDAFLPEEENNTIPMLASRSGLSKSDVEATLNKCLFKGLVIEPKSGLYVKLTDL